MKKITAYTIHEIEGNKSVSVIYDTVNDSGEIIGMNGRAEIEIKDTEAEKAEETLRGYLNSILEE